MDAETVRSYLLKLEHVEETMQWGNNLVFWVGDKALGGKMFALVNLDGDGRAVMSFAAGPERFNELQENDGVIPAPYMARIFWVAMERWDAVSKGELFTLLSAARELTYEKLPKRTKDALAMEPAARKKLIAERRKVLAVRAAAEQKQKKAAPKKAVKKAAKTAARKTGKRDGLNRAL